MWLREDEAVVQSENEYRTLEQYMIMFLFLGSYHLRALVAHESSKGSLLYIN